MSYSPPNIFVNGSPVVAEDVQGNLSAMRDYVNAGAVAGDLKTSAAWANQQHFVRPTYDGVRDVWEGPTGFTAQAQRPLSTGRYSYAQRATSTRQSGSGTWRWLPGTAKELVVPRGARAVLLQFSFSGVCVTDSTVATGTTFGFPGVDVRAFLSTPAALGPAFTDSLTEHLLQVEDARSAAEVSSPITRRGHHSGFILLENLSAQVLTMGLAAKGTLPKGRIWRWSVTAEGWMV